MPPPIDAIAAVEPSTRTQALAPSTTTGRFAELLVGGVEKVNQTVLDAEATAMAFALDDAMPVHQVTAALEHARLSVELMLQVRSRLVEGYQELLRMPL